MGERHSTGASSVSYGHNCLVVFFCQKILLVYFICFFVFFVSFLLR